MISLSFIYPVALALLALLPLLWLFAWVTRVPNSARLGPRRYLALVVLRSLMLAALALALAGTQIVRAVNDTAVVFLLDGSDSVAPAQRERALTYVNEAMAAGQPTDQAAIVVFGASPAVERAASPPAALRGTTSAVVTSRTDIAEAIRLGLALLPADSQKRLVLLSDGAENSGRAAEAARVAALRGIPIEVIPLAAERGPDVLVAALDAPPAAREGQAIPLIIKLESSVAGPSRVEVLADGQLVATQEVTLEPGPGELRLTVPAGEGGFRRFEARVTAPADTQPLNNRAAAFTQVEGPPRVLLIVSTDDRAAPLRAALTAAGLRVQTVAPAQVPADPTQLLQYAAAVLVDVPAADLPSAAQRALATYVRDQGGGLAMIGGTESFGAGGWRRTPIAEVLPVELDPPVTEERPDLALALVIDRSGSMGESAGPGRSKLDLAKEAVFLATQGLARADQVGVFAFDDLAQTALPLQPLPELLAIEESLGRVSLGGGTNIRAGVELAAPALAQVDARVRHMILLTDGLDDSNYTDLIDQMRAQGLTMTIVSIGGDANPSLEAIAQRGGGAFYRVREAQEVPEIFLSETVRVAGRDLVEATFTPAVSLPVPPVRGLGALPSLYGYNASVPRQAARTLLVAPDGSPVLALWQVGLGRSLAWTSDLKGQWARDWLTWERFPTFAAGLIDVVQPPPSAGRLSLDARAQGPQTVLNLFVASDDGWPTLVGSVEGRLLDPQGQATPLRFTQVGFGHYRAVAPADNPGVYLAQVVALDQGGQALGTVSGGVVVSYSPEYGPAGSGATLLADLAALTGGQNVPPPTSVFASLGQRVGRVREIAIPLLWLALILLPLDIALRRLFLRPMALVSRRPRAADQAQNPDPTMERLQAARARARAPRGTPVEQPVAPAPPPSPPSPAAPAPPAASPPPATDDPLAALLAAKGRRKR